MSNPVLANEPPLAIEESDPRPDREAERSSLVQWFIDHSKVFCGLSTIVVVLVAWQVCSDTGLVNPVFVSSPTKVASAFVTYLSSRAFLTDGAASGSDFIMGFGLGVVLGILIGVAMGWFTLAEQFLDYSLSIAYTAPRIALVPLMIVWFGIGTKTEVLTVLLMVVFPMIINTMAGVKTVDRTLLMMAESLGTTRLQLFRAIVLPACVPYILAGIRVSIGTGLIGVVVAEFIASTKGIGFMMSQAANEFQTANVFVGLIIICLVGLLLTQGARMLERRFDRWRITN